MKKDTKRGIATDGKNHFGFNVPMSKNEMEYLVKAFEDAKPGSNHKIGNIAFFGTSGGLEPKITEQFFKRDVQCYSNEYNQAKLVVHFPEMHMYSVDWDNLHLNMGG